MGIIADQPLLVQKVRKAKWETTRLRQPCVLPEVLVGVGALPTR